MARDIMDQKKAEAALKLALKEAEAANRMKDEFLATLSHELRTPLNAVLGWTNILRLEKVEGEKFKQGLEVIDRNARIQAKLIEDLLDMGRIISGKIQLDLRQVDLPTVLTESIETLRTTAEAKGVRLETVVHPFAVPISGDANRLQHVIWNLLHNAIKFTPQGGEVQVQFDVSVHTWKSALQTPVKVSNPSFWHTFSIVSSRRTDPRLVDMADWD
jgi:signal transduction histidine kinase